MHSFSGHTLRSATEGWCGPLIARGATATVGNVFEPYLEYLHRPDLLMEALARGDNLVDAAYYAIPVLSWQSIVVGDPLYRPFAVPLAAQMKSLTSLPPSLAGYAVMRQMNVLDAEGRNQDAINAGKSGMKEVPSMALALALARRVQATGNTQEATAYVTGVIDSADSSTSNWALLHDAAAFLAENKSADAAVDLYRKLFAVDAIPASVRSLWLDEARHAALDAGDAGQAAEWRAEMTQLGRKP
jgi:hypothetical protein